MMNMLELLGWVALGQVSKQKTEEQRIAELSR
jgi:hypothetical protein